MYIRKKSGAVKYKISKRFIVFVSLSAIILIAITGLIILLASGRNLKDSIKKAPFSSGNMVLTQKNGILYTNSDNLIFIDYLSKTRWTKKMFAADVKITSSEKLIAAYNNQKIQLFDIDGNTYYTKEITGDVLNVRCSDDMIAVFSEVETENEGQKKYLTVYDTKDNQVDNIDFYNQQIIDMGFYEKSSMLWVLSLDSTGVIPVSRIVTYNPGKSMKGIIDINDQLIEKLIIDKSSIYASGTTNLYIYSLFGEKKDSILVYGWDFHGQYYLGNKPVFIYTPRNKIQNIYFDSIRIITTDNTDLTIKLPPDVIKAWIYNGRIYCFSQNKIYKYTIEGKPEDEYDLPYAIDSVMKVYENHVFFIKGSDVFTMPLP